MRRRLQRGGQGREGSVKGSVGAGRWRTEDLERCKAKVEED